MLDRRIDGPLSRGGKFNVTAKGGKIDSEYFDWSIAAPNAVLVVLNLGGLLTGVSRLLGGNPQDTGALMMNVSWTFLNLLTLGATARSHFNIRIRMLQIFRAVPGVQRLWKSGLKT